VGELVVQDSSNLETAVREAGVRMAILAVPAAVAQELTDTLAKAGIKAILSYAPVSLNPPDGVTISYSDPVVQLQQMTYYLKPAAETSPSPAEE
jgi:redox-sensing transcriptional repressor